MASAAGVGVLKRTLNGREGGVQLSTDDGDRGNDNHRNQSGNQAIFDGGNAFILLHEGLQPSQSVVVHFIPSYDSWPPSDDKHGETLPRPNGPKLLQNRKQLLKNR